MNYHCVCFLLSASFGYNQHTGVQMKEYTCKQLTHPLYFLYLMMESLKLEWIPCFVSCNRNL